MHRFILRRLLLMVPVVLVTTLIAFSLILLLPGDPAMMMLGEQNATDPAAYRALRAELGLDQPVPLQYLQWLGKALHGDFGHSLRDKLPVGVELAEHALPTLELAALAMVLAVCVAVLAGSVSALRPNS